MPSLKPLLAAVCVAAALAPASHAAEPAAEPLQLVAPQQWNSLPPHMFGYNNNVPAAAGVALPEAPWTAPQMLDAVERLAPGNMRFPGGTLGQFYDWRTERQVPPHVLGKPINDNILQISGNQAGFLEMCRRLDLEPIFVFNLLMDSPDSQWEWVQSLVGADGKPAVTHWELGNEVPEVVRFHSKEYPGPIRSPEDYAAAAKSLGSRILDRWPDARVAVVGAAAIHFQQVHMPAEAPDQAKWNQVLGADRSYYNAVVQHLYLHPWHQFQHRVNWTPRQRTEWMFALADAYPKWIADYHRSYYGDTPLWLTEVGVVTWEGGPPEQRESETAWWSRLVEMNFILSLMADRGPIEVICKHLLAAPGQTMPINVTARDGKLTDASLMSPLGDLLAPIGRATKGGGRIAEVRVAGSPRFEGKLRLADQTYPMVRAIEIANDTQTFLFLINRGESAFDVMMLPGDWSGQTFVSQLRASDSDVEVRSREVAGGSTITLPPYSYTWLSRAGTAEADAR